MSAERSPTIEVEKEIYEKIKKIAKENRQKLKPFVNDILLDIVENGFKKSEIEELTIERNTYRNIVEDFSKNMLGENPSKNLKMIKTTKKNIVMMKDLQNNQIVEISIKNDLPHCNFHNAFSCNHINFILHKTMIFGMKKLQDERDLNKIS